MREQNGLAFEASNNENILRGLSRNMRKGSCDSIRHLSEDPSTDINRSSSQRSFHSRCCKKCKNRRKRRLEVKKRSRSRSRQRSSSLGKYRQSRSPSIPLDPYRTSPSHLEARRITSARKLPVPYKRNWSSSDEETDQEYSSYERY
ncbi:unnamed protein product [Clavelina lepadiformis]|uniref:Serine/arginine repetitive matrix protein C-terminal domain-containing protein n=1 Tax=Clavelina lepadiformis TaxID=159417 RepID=A0ABP0G0K2_CLALP